MRGPEAAASKKLLFPSMNCRASAWVEEVVSKVEVGDGVEVGGWALVRGQGG